MSAIYDESKHPRNPDGKFGVKPASESQATLGTPSPSADLGAVHNDRAQELARDIAVVEQALAKLRDEQARHEVAAFVAKLPPEAHEIDVIEWSDDVVNDYGSFDITLGVVTDADGNVVEHPQVLNIAMRGDDSSPPHWASAFGEQDYPPSSIKVEAVRQWSAAQQKQTGAQPGAWALVSDVEAAKYRQGAEQFRDVVREKFPDAHTLEFARDYDGLGETVSLAEIRDADGKVLYNDADLDEHNDQLSSATDGLLPRFGGLPPGLQPESGGDDYIEVQVSQLDDLDTFLGH